VKSGGHSTNPKFSSTSGVMISMTRISNIDYDPLSMSVNVGTGALWDDVYATLEPHNVNVVGARATGVGVGGFALGGGMLSFYGLNLTPPNYSVSYKRLRIQYKSIWPCSR